MPGRTGAVFGSAILIGQAERSDVARTPVYRFSPLCSMCSPAIVMGYFPETGIGYRKYRAAISRRTRTLLRWERQRRGKTVCMRRNGGRKEDNGEMKPWGIKPRRL